MIGPAPPLLGYRQARSHAPRAQTRIAVCTLGMGIAVGIGQSTLNAAIAPGADFHFIGWERVPGHWIDHLDLSVADGILSGLFLAAIFTVTVAATTRRCCDLKTGLRWFGIVIAADIAIWIFGGLCGLIFSLIHPAWPSFPGFFGAVIEYRLRLAWVCGAVLGYELAGPVVLAGILIRFNRQWSKL